MTDEHSQNANELAKRVCLSVPISVVYLFFDCNISFNILFDRCSLPNNFLTVCDNRAPRQVSWPMAQRDKNCFVGLIISFNVPQPLIKVLKAARDGGIRPPLPRHCCWTHIWKAFIDGRGGIKIIQNERKRDIHLLCPSMTFLFSGGKKIGSILLGIRRLTTHTHCIAIVTSPGYEAAREAELKIVQGSNLILHISFQVQFVYTCLSLEMCLINY